MLAVLNFDFEKFMNVKTQPAQAFAKVLKFWPWLVVMSFLVLIVWILRLGSTPVSESASDVMATPQPSAINTISPQQSTLTHTSPQGTSFEAAAANQVAYGEAESTPSSTHVPENNRTFSIQERAKSLMTWVSGLVSGTPAVNSSVTLATPQASSTDISTTPKQAALETAVPVEVAVADGEVDPVPVVSHLPVAHGEVRNQDRVHAGDDSMYLKDE
jgi:hypothetical protein